MRHAQQFHGKQEYFMLSAKDAKKLSMEVDNALAIKQMKEIEKAITEAASAGKVFVIASMTLAEVVKEQLKSLDYVITTTNGDPCSGGTRTKISW
jgi:methanogenic corrinoid protein MtbC1